MTDRGDHVLHDDFAAFRDTVHADLARMDGKIDELRRTKYAPFFAAAGLFLLIAAGLYKTTQSGLGRIEDKMDALAVSQAVGSTALQHHMTSATKAGAGWGTQYQRHLDDFHQMELKLDALHEMVLKNGNGQ